MLFICVHVVHVVYISSRVHVVHVFMWFMCSGGSCDMWFMWLMCSCYNSSTLLFFLAQVSGISNLENRDLGWGIFGLNSEECTAKRHWLYSNDSMMLESSAPKIWHEPPTVLFDWVQRKTYMPRCCTNIIWAQEGMFAVRSLYSF